MEKIAYDSLTKEKIDKGTPEGWKQEKGRNQKKARQGYGDSRDRAVRKPLAPSPFSFLRGFFFFLLGWGIRMFGKSKVNRFDNKQTIAPGPGKIHATHSNEGKWLGTFVVGGQECM